MVECKHDIVDTHNIVEEDKQGKMVKVGTMEVCRKCGRIVKWVYDD